MRPLAVNGPYSVPRGIEVIINFLNGKYPVIVGDTAPSSCNNWRTYSFLIVFWPLCLPSGEIAVPFPVKVDFRPIRHVLAAYSPFIESSASGKLGAVSFVERMLIHCIA
jgi:hypothetical protein